MSTSVLISPSFSKADSKQEAIRHQVVISKQ